MGAASILCIYPEDVEPTLPHSYKKRSVEEVLASDWEAVNKDFEAVYGDLDRAIEKVEEQNVKRNYIDAIYLNW